MKNLPDLLPSASPDAWATLLVITITVAITVAVALAAAWPSVRRGIGVRWSADDALATTSFATLGTLYAVILGFSVMVSWQGVADQREVVMREAGAAASLYRLSVGLAPQRRDATRAALTRYLGAEIDEDWPASGSAGAPGANSGRALQQVYAALLLPEVAIDVHDVHDAPVRAESLRQLDTLTQARRSRLAQADGVVPKVVWRGLLAGAALLIGFMLLARPHDRRAGFASIAAVAGMTFGGLLLIAAIDAPSGGRTLVEPGPLLAVLRDFA